MDKKGAAPKPTLTEAAGVDLQLIARELIEPNSYNPNVMDPQKFDMLAEDVSEQGLDQPVVVIPHPEKPGRYLIVDGEHRYHAHGKSGKANVLVSIKPWDVNEAKMHTVRRNLLRGSLDPVKFSTLVREVEKANNVSMNDVRKKMGFSTEKEFHKVYREEKVKPPIDVVMAKIEEQVKDATHDVSLVSELVRGIILEYGSSIKAGAICFSYKGAVVLGMNITQDMHNDLLKIKTLMKDLSIDKAQMEGLTKAVIDQMLTTLNDKLAE